MKPNKQKKMAKVAAGVVLAGAAVAAAHYGIKTATQKNVSMTQNYVRDAYRNYNSDIYRRKGSLTRYPFI